MREGDNQQQVHLLQLGFNETQREESEREREAERSTKRRARDITQGERESEIAGVYLPKANTEGRAIGKSSSTLSCGELVREGLPADGRRQDSKPKLPLLCKKSIRPLTALSFQLRPGRSSGSHLRARSASADFPISWMSQACYRAHQLCMIGLWQPRSGRLCARSLATTHVSTC